MRIVAAAKDAELLAALATRFDVARARTSWHALRLAAGAQLAVVGPPYGVELIRALRREKQPPPIICILGSIDEAEAALSAGAVLVVTPPLIVNYIVDVIEAWSHDTGSHIRADQRGRRGHDADRPAGAANDPPGRDADR